MLKFFRTTMNPACCHVHKRKPPFFEGWYFKVVDAAEEHRYAVIPGISLGHDASRVATRAQGGLLHAPTTTDMSRRIAETLNAAVDVRLVSFGRGVQETLFEGTGRHAGLEAVGDMNRLVSMWQRSR